MNQEKYIGMDVHQATISVAVLDSSGKLIMECILETAGSRDKIFSPSGRGRTFFLTFLFIERFDPETGGGPVDE
jgi:hypothetical protein